MVNYLPAGRLLSGYYFLAKNHLKKSGWRKSVIKKMPVDRNSNELPWLTYSCIYFLDSRLYKELTVFEYGSGNSTLWFSNRIKKIVSVEHSKKWYVYMKEKFSGSSNIEYFFRDLESGSYQKEILNYTKTFDIIIIDGRKRVDCSLNSLGALKDDGVILWDNSDRMKYSKGYDFLLSNGFRRIDFWGMGPVSAHSWCSSVFYRETNCLKI
jgi:hypothetical protein